MDNTPGENKEFSVYQSSKNESEHIAGKDEKSRFGRTLANTLAIGGLAFTQGGGHVEVNAQRLAELKNSEEKNPPITEQYREEITDESESNSEFVIDKTGGLDSEGFPIEKEVVIENEEIREINEILDITKWEGYELDSREEIDPTYYIPSGVKGSYLWVIPLVDLPMDKIVNKNQPILEYKLPFGEDNPLKVEEIITISSPGGYKLILGIPHEYRKWSTFNAEFFTLLEVYTPESEHIKFSSNIGERDLESIAKQESYTFDDESDWITTNIFHGGINNYYKLLELYNPIEHNIGNNYDFRTVKSFTELVHRESLSHEFTHALLYRYLDSPNKVLERYWDDSMENGFFKEELLLEDENLNYIDKNIVNITGWEGYDLLSVEEIEPKYYIPNKQNPAGSFLWVVPRDEKNKENKQILEYQLFSENSNSLEVSKIVRISTKNNYEVILGVINQEDKNSDINLITLLEVIQPNKEKVVYSSEDFEEEKSLESLRSSQKYITPSSRQQFFFYNRMLTVNNIFYSGIENFNELKEQYDPEYYLVGKKYDANEVLNFSEITDTIFQ